MNVFRAGWCRFYQKIMYVGMAFMPWRQPEVRSGDGYFAEHAADFLLEQGVTRPLVVCDQAALDRHALDGFFAGAEGRLQPVVYSGVLPNPTVKQVEEGLALYLQNNCNGILAFGGGSPMDCAKAIGARVVCPQKSVNQLKGLLKVRKRLPPFFAVPTTAGTGSECTVAAVITDSDTHDKYAINSFALIPHFCIHDATLTAGLPPMLTATTGMDALTHAVEAYVGHANTRHTKQQAVEAVKLVFENLQEATTNGQNLAARRNMQRAAYLAGLAFTRAYVGYVHALAHSLGGKYGIAHGLANAILLPAVLQKYGKSAHKRLAKLAEATNIAHGGTVAERAQAFIDAIIQLNLKLGIPGNFGGKIATADIPELARHAAREANPLYPVPKLWDEHVFQEIYKQVQ